MHKTLSKVFIVLLLIPLGIISKILYFIHKKINILILNIKSFLDEGYVKKWRTIWNQESEDSSWEIVNYYDNDLVGDKKTIVLYYFNDDNDETNTTIEMSVEEFEDLLDFAKTLNKKVLNK